MTPDTLVTVVYVSCACTCIAVGLAIHAFGRARAWEEAWRATVQPMQRAPQLTRVMSQVAPWGEPSPDPLRFKTR